MTVKLQKLKIITKIKKYCSKTANKKMKSNKALIK